MKRASRYFRLRQLTNNGDRKIHADDLWRCRRAGARIYFTASELRHRKGGSRLGNRRLGLAFFVADGGRMCYSYGYNTIHIIWNSLTAEDIGIKLYMGDVSS